MKYFNKITLGLILCAGFVSSCKDDDETGFDGITVDKEEITIGAEGGTEKISISSNDQWVARVSDPWIAVSPANGMGSADCVLAIDSTLENVARTAKVRFSMDNREPRMVTVTQFGFGKQILVRDPEVEIPSSDAFKKRQFEATISTNINFKIEGVDYSFAEEATMTDEEKAEVEGEKKNWLTLPAQKDLEVNLDRGARPRMLKVNFRWGMNVAPFTRVAKIKLVPVDPEDQLLDNDGNEIDVVVLTVTQKAAMKIEDNRAGDSLAVITINSKLQTMMSFDTSESMINWDFVTLWEATDKEIKNNELPAEAVGRVRSVSFSMIDLQDGESLPKEIRYLKYLESFTVQSNANRQIRTIQLGDEICELEYLKSLTIFSIGVNVFPENFKNLGKTLVNLDLTSNNFKTLSAITDVVNEENFPVLRHLSFTGCRTTETLKDLSLIENGQYNGRDAGLCVDISQGQAQRQAFLKLLTWDKLITLQMAYNFIEGELPTDEEVTAALRTAGKPLTYKKDDFFSKEELAAKPSIFLDKISSDTCQWLLTKNNEVTYQTQAPVTGQDVPRVLPLARSVRLNLNFLTGKVPNWILFHPYFAYWHPETLIFNQQEDGLDSKGNPVGFSNVNLVNYDYSYYYGKEDPGDNPISDGVAYPLYFRVFVLSGTTN